MVRKIFSLLSKSKRKKKVVVIENVQMDNFQMDNLGMGSKDT